MKRMWNWLAPAAVLAMLAAGCTTTVEYGDPTSGKAVDTGFGSADLQKIAAKMVDSLLADEILAEISSAGPPLLIVDKVKNKTMQHIDTESITDSIRTRLIKSRMFSFQDRTTEAALQEELADARRDVADWLERALAESRGFVRCGGRRGSATLAALGGFLLLLATFRKERVTEG